MSFPRQYARTKGFGLGVPRHFTVSPDGSRVVFGRTRGGSDSVQCLWTFDVATGAERLTVDPSPLLRDGEELTPEEQARRERVREKSSGITAYATDAAVQRAAFDLGGHLWVADLLDGTGSTPPRELPAAGPIADPRPSPDGENVAYVARGELRVIGFDGSGDRPLAVPEGPDVGYGLAEHVAAESMYRYRGHWWSPESDRLVVARVDNSAVETWYLSDPANPAAAPRSVRYPVAGTANADVSLWIVGLDGGRVAVDWDRAEFEYVVSVGWDSHGLLVVVQNRAQSLLRVLAVDHASGRTRVLRENHHDTWVPIMLGVPAHTGDGALVWTDDLRRLATTSAATTSAATTWAGTTRTPTRPRPPGTCSSTTSRSRRPDSRSTRSWTSTARRSCSPPPTSRPRRTCGPGPRRVG